MGVGNTDAQEFVGGQCLGAGGDCGAPVECGGCGRCRGRCGGCGCTGGRGVSGSPCAALSGVVIVCRCGWDDCALVGEPWWCWCRGGHGGGGVGGPGLCWWCAGVEWCESGVVVKDASGRFGESHCVVE
ncbi:hypothetical protein CEP80_13320 [Jonesia denitrificans]|nr:hypothetical protein CEP80_13320 [Jonesia denitrificans]